jgi:hypothetical protein
VSIVDALETQKSPIIEEKEVLFQFIKQVTTLSKIIEE